MQRAWDVLWLLHLFTRLAVSRSKRRAQADMESGRHPTDEGGGGGRTRAFSQTSTDRGSHAQSISPLYQFHPLSISRSRALRCGAHTALYQQIDEAWPWIRISIFAPFFRIPLSLDSDSRLDENRKLRTAVIVIPVAGLKSQPWFW